MKVSMAGFRVTLLLIGVYIQLGNTLGTQGSPVLRPCNSTDFHYEYTECDSEGGRWRVSVPKPNTCTGGAPNAPVRGKGCTFQCKPGQYLDIQGDQECKPCPEGTYSMGGGVRFEDWDTLPDGFTVQTESFIQTFSDLLNQESYADVFEKNISCAKSGWTPQGREISASPADCVTTLVYSAKLVKAGSVNFKYQFPDEKTMFHFTVQNDQCQTVEDDDSSSLQMTEAGDWNEETIMLKSGLNILSWKVMSIGTAESEGAPTLRHPVLLKDVEITGIAYTSECTKCRPGTFSPAGASTCKQCPENTHSDRGAGACQGCNKDTEYSKKGAKECTKRPPCKTTDYYEEQTPCDKDKKTQKKYRWIEPKVCLDNAPGAAKLPAPGPKNACPPCNPGMEFVNGQCKLCPPNHYSNGSLPCQKCPASTAAEAGLQLKWWNSIPESLNITTSCISVLDKGCASEKGWQFGTDYIHSGIGHADDVYVVLIMRLSGFKGHEVIIEGKPQPVGKISFLFEMDCKKDCELYFMQTYKNGGTNVIKRWKYETKKQYVTHEITKTDAVTFTWAFQKTASLDVKDGQFQLIYDEAKVYSINVTNTLQGGAAACKRCPRGAQNDGCVPCPKGHYLTTNTSACVECPANMVVQSWNPLGEQACRGCGEGLVTKDHSTCETHCKYTSPAGEEYDFTKLKGVMEVTGSKQFSSSGTQYYHLFNISMCPSSENDWAVCRDNITSDGPKHDSVPTEVRLHSQICRSTIIPPKAGTKKLMMAQPSSLGENLVNITTNGTSLNIKHRMIEAGFEYDEDYLDVHFTYLSETPTYACPDGRTTIVTMRCDPQTRGRGRLELPPKCPDGTCDGCTFHFLWRARAACPTCKEDSYKIVKGECVGGHQEIHYIPKKHCIFMDETKEKVERRKCPRWPPLWVLITVGCIVVTGIFMCGLLLYCWSKNKKLEVKYMKLVQNSNLNDGELPGVDSCALDEGEEDDFDAVKFQESKGRKFFNRIKSLGKKDDNPFETIQLTDSTDKA